MCVRRGSFRQWWGGKTRPHRPSGGGVLGEDSDWWTGACRKPRRNPQRGQLPVFKHTASSPLPLTLRWSIAKGNVNREAATVMLWSYSIRLSSTFSSNTCFSPKAVTQGQARTDTQTRTHRNNLYNGCSLNQHTKMAALVNLWTALPDRGPRLALHQLTKTMIN